MCATISDDMRSLVEQAVGQGVPRGVAAAAAEATRARFAGSRGVRPGRRRDYFWGVVRRQAMRGRAPEIQRRIMALSLADELAASGCTPGRVVEEVARIYGVECARAVVAVGAGAA